MEDWALGAHPFFCSRLPEEEVTVESWMTWRPSRLIKMLYVCICVFASVSVYVCDGGRDREEEEKKRMGGVLEGSRDLSDWTPGLQVAGRACCSLSSSCAVWAPAAPSWCCRRFSIGTALTQTLCPPGGKREGWKLQILVTRTWTTFNIRFSNETGIFMKRNKSMWTRYVAWSLARWVPWYDTQLSRQTFTFIWSLPR